MKKRVIFTKHAKIKLALLREYGFYVSVKEVENAIGNPERIRHGYEGRKIAERHISEEHLLRVVYEEMEHELKIITLYPARRSRYEDEL